MSMNDYVCARWLIKEVLYDLGDLFLTAAKECLSHLSRLCGFASADDTNNRNEIDAVNNHERNRSVIKSGDIFYGWIFSFLCLCDDASQSSNSFRSLVLYLPALPRP